MKFSHKISFSTVGALVIGLTAASAVFYTTASDIFEKRLKAEAASQALHITDTLDEFMLQRSRDMNVVSASSLFKSAPLDAEVIGRRLDEYLNDWNIYSAISFYDITGRCVADTSGCPAEVDETTRRILKEALEKGDSTGIELSASTAQEPAVYFSSLVLGDNSTAIGIVVGEVPVAYLRDVTSDGELFQSELIDQNHRIIFTSRHDGREPAEFGTPFSDEGVLDELRSGKHSGFTGHHWSQSAHTHYAAFATESGFREFEGNGWTVVLWIPKSYISTPLNTLMMNAAALLFLAVVAATLLSAYLGRQLSKPLKQLTDAAEAVGRGDLDVRIDYQGEDEFGELAHAITSMSTDLKTTRARLEQQVSDRTQQLEETVKKTKDLQEITLSILEDTNEAKTELTKSNASLKIAQTEISEFARNLEERVTERTRELAVLYDISNDVSYTNDYQALAQLIMESFSKIADYDICALLLFAPQSAILGMKITYAPAEKFSDEIRTTLIESVQTLTGESIHNKKLTSKLISPNSTDAPKGRIFTKIRSSLDLPLVVSGKTMGAISITSCEENAFSEEATRLMRTITNHISSTLARLHTTLTAEKTKMEFMVESMSEGIIMTDENDAIIVCNPRAREFIGVSTREYVPAQTLIEHMQALGLMDLLHKCKTAKAPEEQVITTQMSGRNVFIKCDATPVYNPDCTTIGYVIILRDVTKERELDLIKTEFISTVSHELRTPLSITKEGISLILDKTVGDLNERQSLFLTAAKNNIDRLTNIINDLLDIAKIDAGKMTLNLEPTDFSELLRQMVDSFQIRAKRKGIGLKTRLTAGQITIPIDNDKITQVVVNLIDNAMKFTDKGHIEVVLEDLGSEIMCTIEDTGVGISRGDLKNLFKKFQQFNRVESEEKGTGLGLSIVKGLVELHNGKVWAESELEVGTKFHFTLPKLATPHVSL